ncbi:MAG TPA: hypothetical protein VGF48_25730 [Thermoanaerobaculia bacterium]
MRIGRIRIDRDVAAIVCAGPSLDLLTPQAWSDLAHAGAIVSVNGAAAADACRDLPFTILAAMDICLGLYQRVPALESIWTSTAAWRVTSADGPHVEAESYLREVDEEHGVHGWSDDPDEGYRGGSTGMIIGNWMANRWASTPQSAKPIPPRGFRRLAYLGLDMQPNDGRHAAGAGLHSSGFARSREQHQRVADAWGLFCREGKSRGVEIVNLTPGSGLTTMPRVEVPAGWLSRSAVA